MGLRLKNSLAWKILLPVPIATAAVVLSIWYFLPSVIADNVRADATADPPIPRSIPGPGAPSEARNSP